VTLRADGTPGPEKCSEEALKTMRILRMYVGDAADISLDANQIDARPIALYEGPVESFLDESLGTLDAGTRLYYAAKPPNGGDTLPICAVARMGRGQMRKKPESLPGTAILDYPGALAFVVDDFR
jgi:hypothetical protein